MISNIQQSMKWEMCTGCGTCAGACENLALKMIRNFEGVYVPVLNSDLCNQCQVCIEVCPGLSVNSNEIKKNKSTNKKENIFIGDYLNCYIGYAVDLDVRYNSSSGGLVTALLIFALEEGIIDGALVTKMCKSNPLEPEVFIARNKEQLISASKSKYCPVPLNSVIKEILNGDGNYAIVGLPCHIHGIRKIEKINPRLKQKIKLHVGLFCHHTPNFYGTEFLLQKMNIRKENIKKLSYRGSGWPGMMTIDSKDNYRTIIPYEIYSTIIFGGYFFVPTRCTLCTDGTSELADISFGDAWQSNSKFCKSGESVIVSRTAIGEKILQNMISKNRIILDQISVRDVIQGQKGMLCLKKKTVQARFLIRNFFHKSLPKNNSILLDLTITDFIIVVLQSFNMFISSKNYSRKLLRHIPFPMFKMYAMILAFLLFKSCSSERNNVPKFLKIKKK